MWLAKKILVIVLIMIICSCTIKNPSKDSTFHNNKNAKSINEITDKVKENCQSSDKIENYILDSIQINKFFIPNLKLFSTSYKTMGGEWTNEVMESYVVLKTSKDKKVLRTYGIFDFSIDLDKEMIKGNNSYKSYSDNSCIYIVQKNDNHYFIEESIFQFKHKEKNKYVFDKIVDFNTTQSLDNTNEYLLSKYSKIELIISEINKIKKLTEVVEGKIKREFEIIKNSYASAGDNLGHSTSSRYIVNNENITLTVSDITYLGEYNYTVLFKKK